MKLTIMTLRFQRQYGGLKLFVRAAAEIRPTGDRSEQYA
jgi:hypothetical protein